MNASMGFQAGAGFRCGRGTGVNEGTCVRREKVVENGATPVKRERGRERESERERETKEEKDERGSQSLAHRMKRSSDAQREFWRMHDSTLWISPFTVDVKEDDILRPRTGPRMSALVGDSRHSPGPFRRRDPAQPATATHPPRRRRVLRGGE